MIDSAAKGFFAEVLSVQHVVYLDPHVAHEYVPISTWENLSIPEVLTEEEKVGFLILSFA